MRRIARKAAAVALVCVGGLAGFSTPALAQGSTASDEDDERPRTYVVRSGDSVAAIAYRFDVSVEALLRANGLRSDLIHPGQRLKLPPAQPPTPRPTLETVTEDELEILARIIKGEMPPDGPFEGKVAIAAVILNRVQDPRFPSSIRKVAHQPGQFSCYNPRFRQRLYYGRIPQEAWDAARAALRGEDPTHGATHYFNPHLVTPDWVGDLVFTVRIGTRSHTTHSFYRIPGRRWSDVPRRSGGGSGTPSTRPVRGIADGVRGTDD